MSLPTNQQIIKRLRTFGYAADIYRAPGYNFFICKLFKPKGIHSEAAGTTPRSALFAAILELIRNIDYVKPNH